MAERGVRWRSLGALFAAGGALTLASLALPHPEGLQAPAIAILGGLALVSGALMILAAPRLPAALGWISASLAFGTVLISGGVYFTHDADSSYGVLYLLVAFDGYFFLARRAALAHVAFVAGSYAAVLVAISGPRDAPAPRWLLTVGTVVVVGLLADMLRERTDLLIARLKDAASTDALTGLLNRRGFEEAIDGELERSRRTGAPLSLLVGDIDHFKRINDQFGHRHGDRALQLFGDVAMATKRRIDMAARIGGEEFALVLPATDEHGGYLMAERLRRRVREALASHGDGMSVSFGVATYPRHGETAEHLIQSGDQALYLAKRLGRDRSVIYSEEVAASLQAERPAEPATVEQLSAVLVLAETLDLRDAGTAMHSQTVGRYAERIARHIGLAPPHVERVRLAGLLHDIGKVGVPDPILRKPGLLHDAETTEMRKHPELGARILAGANLDDLSGWVLAHHERPDGQGYPAGLAGDEIPVEARILAVADAFEAMTSDRVYRPALSIEAAIAQLQDHVGTQFDARIVAAFVESVTSDGVEDPTGGPAPETPTSSTSSRAASRFSS
jgi:diguanylate cyclase (GGDEF)-like protein/putative nucleotidyltransferase with HDIG domain